MARVRLPKKPGVSCILAHSFCLLPSSDPLKYTNKLDEICHVLFQSPTIHTKSLATQTMLFLRSLLYFHHPRPILGLGNDVLHKKYTKVRADATFMSEIHKVVNKLWTVDQQQEVYDHMARPISGGPFHTSIYAKHRAYGKSIDDVSKRAVFEKWNRTANFARDLDTSFKPSTLQNLQSSLLRDGFVRHGLQRNKTYRKPSKRKIGLVESKQVPTRTPSLCNDRRYPDPPPDGWVAVMGGKSLTNFVTRMASIIGKQMQISIRLSDKGRYVMCLYISKEQTNGQFVLLNQTRIILFKTSLQEIPPIKFNAKDAIMIVQLFSSDSVCLVCKKTSLTFSGTGTSSSLTMILPIQTMEIAHNHRKMSTFHAIAKANLRVKLIQPLTKLFCDKISILCQIDPQENRLYMTFKTSKAANSNIVTIHRFTGDLVQKNQPTQSNQKNQITKKNKLGLTDDMGVDIPLFHINTSAMHACTLAPKNDSPQTTIERAYVEAKERLEQVFLNTYSIHLVRMLVKKIKCDNYIRFVMTKERLLLMTVNEYRGAVQVAQMPLRV